MKYIRWLLIVAILFATSACTRRVYTPSVVPEWGRAGLIGVSSRAESVSLVAGAGGKSAMLAWPVRSESGQDYIHLYILTTDGSVWYDADLKPQVQGLDQVKLANDGLGNLHLIWTAGLQNAREMWFAPLPEIPQMIESISLQPTQIVQLEDSVIWFESHPWGSDDFLIVWLNDNDNVYIQIGPTGTQHNVLQNVKALDTSLNAQGSLEIVWTTITDEDRVEINITSLDTIPMQLSMSQTVTSIRLPRDQNVSYVGDLTISINENQRTVSWTQPYDYGGRSARQLVTATMTGHKNIEKQPSDLYVYPLTRSFPPELSMNSKTNMHMVHSSRNSVNETNVRGANSSTAIPDVGIVLAASVQYTTRTREAYQPTLIYISSDGFLGHYPLTWTDHASIYPVVAGDKIENLYAAWIDNIGMGFHYPVYLSTTHPDIQMSYQHLSLIDYMVIGWDWLNRAVMGVVLLPFIIQWFLLPICYLVVILIRGERYGSASAHTLLGGLFLYWAGKYLITSPVLLLLPDFGNSAPSLQVLLPLLLPLFTLCVSVIGEAAYRFLTHSRDDGLFSRFIRITLPDAVLSMLIYAIGSFG